jgi:hypothetical protein
MAASRIAVIGDDGIGKEAAPEGMAIADAISAHAKQKAVAYG